MFSKLHKTRCSNNTSSSKIHNSPKQTTRSLHRAQGPKNEKQTFPWAFQRLGVLLSPPVECDQLRRLLLVVKSMRLITLKNIPSKCIEFVALIIHGTCTAAVLAPIYVLVQPSSKSSRTPAGSVTRRTIIHLVWKFVTVPARVRELLCQ